MEEKVTLVRQLGQRMKDQGSQPDAGKYEEYAGKVDAEVSLVRELILNGATTKRNVLGDEEQK
jgi:hypothetical protein